MHMAHHSTSISNFLLNAHKLIALHYYNADGHGGNGERCTAIESFYFLVQVHTAHPIEQLR